ncbi:MAG: hypothetical protein K6F76_04535 [Clostridiales bacterium]|nr:hypothetical protein [Clostridiales bacterium]
MRINKRILSMILSLTLILASVTFAASADALNKNDCRNCNSNGTGRSIIGYRAESMAQGAQRYASRGEDLPSYYDARTTNCITPVRDQFSYNCCWAFSIISASESSLIKKNGYNLNNMDLSELHLVYHSFGPAADAMNMLEGDNTYPVGNTNLNVGGLMYMSTITLARWNGVVNESDAKEYTFQSVSDGTLDLNDPSNAYKNNVAVLNEARWISMKDTNYIKKNIMTNGSGVIAYYTNDSYMNTATSAYYYDGNREANHEVCVVGWDDNYSRENFLENHRPAHNGAWLVKGSYGTDYGNNGYYWLSYEDVALNKEDVCFLDYIDKDTYTHNYQYDGTSNFTGYADSTPTGKDDNTYLGGGNIANVYTAQGNEILKAVSFFTCEAYVNYEVKIYTGLPQNATSPTSGTLKQSFSGKTDYCGYHTVTLPKNVELKEGEKFAVVIKLTKGSDKYITLMCDYTDKWAWIGFNNTTHAGESYFSENGTNWKDVGLSDGVNFRIKALTVDNDNPVQTTDSEPDTSTDTHTDTATDTHTDTAADTATDTHTDTASDTAVDTESEDDDIIIIILDDESDSDTLTDTEKVSDTDTETVPERFLLGDVNCDNVVNMEDVTSLQKIIALLAKHSDFGELSRVKSDTRFDDIINMEDVVLIQKYIAKLIPDFEGRLMIQNK